MLESIEVVKIKEIFKFKTSIKSIYSSSSGGSPSTSSRGVSFIDLMIFTNFYTADDVYT